VPFAIVSGYLNRWLGFQESQPRLFMKSTTIDHNPVTLTLTSGPGTAAVVRSVVCHDPEGARAWDIFMSECPGAHVEQSSAWGTLKQMYGWKPIWVWVTRDMRIIGGAMLLTRSLGRFATIGYVERGPVWDPAEEGSMELATDALLKLAQSLSLTYVAIAPPYCGDNAIRILKSWQFRQKPEALFPSGVGRATLLIDLQRDLNALLADMSMTRRQNVRRGLRKGVQVRVGCGADAGTVRDLMWLGCKRRGINPYPPQKDFFESLWRTLGQHGTARFFIAEIAGEPVSAACAQVFGGTLQLWRVGWSGQYEDHNPNDVLHWEVIKWAKENGCRTFDFMHIRPDHARAILRGEKVKDSYSGVTDFKTSFGGQLHLLPELYYRSFHPVGPLALNLGMARFLGSKRCLNALNKVGSRFLHSRAG